MITMSASPRYITQYVGVWSGLVLAFTAGFPVRSSDLDLDQDPDLDLTGINFSVLYKHKHLPPYVKTHSYIGDKR